MPNGPADARVDKQLFKGVPKSLQALHEQGRKEKRLAARAGYRNLMAKVRQARIDQNDPNLRITENTP